MCFQPGEGPSRGLLRDCTTGCGTDGLFYSISNNIMLRYAKQAALGTYANQPTHAHPFLMTIALAS